MKIDVIVPSRGHPLRLMAVLTCFDALATGENDITYRVICDMDDPLTFKVADTLPFKVAMHAGSGPLSKRMNEAAKEGGADLVTGAADDTFPLAQHWDGLLTIGAEQNVPAFSWQEVNDPTNTTMVVFGRKWLDAVGRMLPEYFPFWFGDTWVAEVFELAFCKPLPIVANLPWGGKRGKTSGMRDLKFWFEFFAATRVERVAEARAVCFAYGIPYEAPDDMIVDMERRDAEQIAKVPQYEEWFGTKEPQTEQYTQMRQAADDWLMHNRGTVQ